MSRWVKLHAKISESYDFAEVHAEDKNAALLFLLALPQADVFGVLPGHPAILKGKLCSMLDITEEQVSNAFDVLVSHKLLIEYTDSNHRRLYIIPKYAEYQDTRWSRISAPDYELPESWVPPSDMLASIQKYPDSDIAKWWKCYCETRNNNMKNDTSRDYSGTTPGLLRDYSRPETETETETETDNDSATPAENPAVVAADLILQTEQVEQKTKQKQPRTKPQTPHVLFAEAVWVLFKQELPCPGAVVKAAGQFINAHGIPGTETFIKWLLSSSLAVVPEGAKPEACIAKVIRDGNSQSFKWNGEKRNGSPLRMSLAGAQWPKETEII